METDAARIIPGAEPVDMRKEINTLPYRMMPHAANSQTGVDKKGKFIMMIAPVFSGEYSGVDNIMLTGKYEIPGGQDHRGHSSCPDDDDTCFGIEPALCSSAVWKWRTGWRSFLPLLILIGDISPSLSLVATCSNIRFFYPFTGTVSITDITLFLSALCKKRRLNAGGFCGNCLSPCRLALKQVSCFP